MRVFSVFIYISMISVLFFFPIETFAANDHANKHADKSNNKTNQMTPIHKKATPSRGKKAKNAPSQRSASNKQEPPLPKQENPIAEKKVQKEKETAANPPNSHKETNRKKNTPPERKGVSNHGRKVSEEAKPSKLKGEREEGKQKTEKNRENVKQEEPEKQTQLPKTNDSGSPSQKYEKNSLVRSSDVKKPEEGSSTERVQESVQKTGKKSGRDPEQEPNKEPVHRPIPILITSPPEAPATGNGGASAGTASASFVLKSGILTGEAQILSDQTQFFMSRIKTFRSQWVNAPPIQPPVVTS